ncbi:cold shock and DUF1294 domain-containing protein [Sodalinema gerasimenkoae]|uniref:DUF1294 domain-containing protein n=1 Tax=Sodalinema gerasimenkoae TaxID=2862348 RepID=UPI00135CC683
MTSKLQIGRLIKWNDERGFGFIQGNPSQPQVFIHISALKKTKRRPKVGDEIQYSITHKKGKIRACDASILGATSQNTPPRSPAPLRHSQSKRPPVPWLQVALVSIVPLLGSLQLLTHSGIFAPLIVYPLMSLVTFKLYAEDKSRAQQKQWRIPENILHLSELAGGWLGGIIAQRRLRHKSVKRSYQITFWGIVILHQAIGLGVIVLFLQGQL